MLHLLQQMFMLCMQQLRDSKHTMHNHVQAITQHFIRNAITKLDNDQAILWQTPQYNAVKVSPQILHIYYMYTICIVITTL